METTHTHPSRSVQERVLMVDDEPVLLETFDVAFRRAGWPIVTCGSFEDGRAKLLQERFDVLVTDVRLGAFNGLQLAIIARDRDPDIKIIVFSGFDDPVLQEEAKHLGARYLVKPVEFDQLVKVMKSM